MPEWEPQCPAEYVKTDVVGPLRLLARVFPKSELDSSTFSYVSYVARYTKGIDSLRVLLRGTTIYYCYYYWYSYYSYYRNYHY